MPWNNFQGFRVYAKTLKYKNFIALNILFNRNFRIEIIYLMFLILIPWNKLISDTFIVIPWHKNKLLGCFRVFTVPKFVKFCL
jgi:hypothetical protein